MKSIQLSPDELHKVWSYDDGKLFWKVRPSYRVQIGDEAGSLAPSGYWQVCYEYEVYRRHRMVYYMHTGEWPELIDHIDRDITNDRFENLRKASKSLNAHNSISVKGAVPFRGVFFDRQRNKYRSEIEVEKKRIVLGRFDTAEEASLVYEEQKRLRTSHLM